MLPSYAETILGTLMRSSLPKEPRSGVPPVGGSPYGEPCLPFHLVHAQYDRRTRRAYVELRNEDADGGEVIVTAIFSYRCTSIITKRALEQDLATRARYLMRRASIGLSGGREPVAFLPK